MKAYQLDMLYFNCGHSSVKPGQLRDNNDNGNDNFAFASVKKQEKLGQSTGPSGWANDVRYNPHKWPSLSPQSPPF